MRRARVALAVLAVASATVGIVVAGCSATARPRTDTSASGAARAQVVLYAASSLTNSFQTLARAYETAHPDVGVVLAFDSSSALRARIEQGAPADVLASAGGDAIDRLVRAGLTRGSAAAFAQNRLALIVPNGNAAAIASPQDLARPGVRIVAAGEGVPVTVYAKELIARLASSPLAPPDFVARVNANVVSREDNVRAVLAKIELGEGDAAIVYETDARGSTAVRSIPLDDVNVNVVYAAIALAHGPAGERGAEFVQWLRSTDAQTILADAGFGAAP